MKKMYCLLDCVYQPVKSPLCTIVHYPDEDPAFNRMTNIFISHLKTIRFIESQKEETEKLLKYLQQRIKPDDLISDLRIGQQQIVEIAKALAEDVRILIMDEPTSALSTAEVNVLFGVIRELKEAGVSIIYISHKLDELLQIGDYVTILRDGRLVADAPASEVDVSWIIEEMVGRNPTQFFQGEAHEIGEELMRVEDP